MGRVRVVLTGLFVVGVASLTAALEDVSKLVTYEVAPAGSGGFVRGDCNQDLQLNIADAVCALSHLFKQVPTTCKDSLDANDDGKVDIADPIYVLGHLFAHGPAPKPPFPACGIDPSLDLLGCERFDACTGGGGGGLLVTLANSSRTAVFTPLIAVLEATTPPGATLESPDGVYAGKPYIAYSGELDGGVLAPGAETPAKLWKFIALGSPPTGLTLRLYANTGAGGWLPGSDPLGEDAGAPVAGDVSADLGGVEFAVELPGVRVTPISQGKAVFQALSARNTNPMSAAGRPGLPVFTQVLAVPKNARVTVQIGLRELARYSGFRVYPTQHSPGDNREEPLPPFAYDEKFYSQNATYPAAPYALRELTMRGVRLVLLQIPLAETNPAQGSLALCRRMQVSVKFDGGAWTPDDYQDPRDRVLADEGPIPTLTLNDRVFRNDLLEVVRDRVFFRFYDMLIVAPLAFADAAMRLHDWKEGHMGLSTVVAYTSDIGSTADEIATYIQGQYSRSRISYVLLLGDAEHIPPHYRTHHPTGHGNRRMGTDLYYAVMDGADDLIPDVAIGRIPASTLEEADRIVDKVIAYESTPPVAPAFYNRVLLAAYFQDDTSLAQPNGDGRADRRFADTAETLFDFFTDNGRSPQRVYMTDANITPRWWWDGDVVPDSLRKPMFPWDGDAADVEAQLETGTFLVAHRDHGATDGWSEPQYRTANVDVLANGDLQPVVFSMNCQTGWFDMETDEEGAATDEECFSEHFLLRDGGGAVGVVCATRNSPSYCNDDTLLAMIDCVWPTLLPDYPGEGDAEAEGLAGSRRMGWVLAYGKLYALAVWGDDTDGGANPDDITIGHRECEIYHYLGDPSMCLRTRAPLRLVMPPLMIEPYLFDYPFPELSKEAWGARLAIVEGGHTVGSGVVTDLGARCFLPKETPLRPGDETYLAVVKEGYAPALQKIAFTKKCFLYSLAVPTTAAGTNALDELGLRADGEPVPLGSQTLGGKGVQSAAESELAATAAYLFAAHNASGAIEMMQFRPSAAPLPLPGSPFRTAGKQPSHLAVNAAGDRLFATTGEHMLEMFAITEKGLIAVRGSPVSVDGSARDLAAFAYKLRTFLYVGSLAGPRGVLGFEVLADGLGYMGALDLANWGAGSPGIDVIAGKKLPYLFVLDGSAGVFVCRIDEGTGALAVVKGSPFKAGDVNTAMAVDASESFLFVAYGGLQGLPQIASFRIEDDGTLTRLGVESSLPSIVSLAIDCDNQYLYGASPANKAIARWAIKADGTLSFLGSTPSPSTTGAPAAVLAR